MRFVSGFSRFQQSILTLDDQIGADNVVRFIDQVCNNFIINNLKDTKKGRKDTGRKAYHPRDLLKLFVYGYFNGISSSRKIERECGRNIEVQWLLSGLAPDHKTISDFRKNNPDLIRDLFLFLMERFKEQGLVTGKKIAVDGTKIKAYASKEINLSGIQKKLDNIKEQVDKYMEELASMDDFDDFCEVHEEKKKKLLAEIAELEDKKKDLTEAKKGLEDEELKKKCTTDPDARTMKARYGSFYGYNFQIAVDIDSHMVTEYLLSKKQNDKGLLAEMVTKSEEVMGQKPEEAQADAGYYKVSEIEGIEKNETECYVAVNRTGSQKKDEKNGLEFIYDPEKDRYKCSGGRFLDYYRKKTEDGNTKRIYKSGDCSGCPFLDACTKPGAKERNRTFTRNHNQEWLDRYKQKMKGETGRDKLRQRKAVAEHPFGTMKYYMGQMPTVLRGEKKVSSEMALYTIAYNIRRYKAIKA